MLLCAMRRGDSPFAAHVAILGCIGGLAFLAHVRAFGAFQLYVMPVSAYPTIASLCNITVRLEHIHYNTSSRVGFPTTAHAPRHHGWAIALILWDRNLESR